MIRKLKSVPLFIALMMTVNSYAQDASTAALSPEPNSNSIFSNPLFISMALLSTVLMIVIFILSAVLRTSVKTKVRELIGSGNARMIVTALLVFGAQSAFAQETVAVKSIYESEPIAGMHPWAFYTLFAVLLLELFVILWLCLVILRIIVKREEASALATNGSVKSESAFAKFISRKIFGVKPVETDKDVLLDHDYDGIKELDNDLPPWWKYGFYMTIISGIVYMVGYHITGSFKLSHEEYVAEVTEGEAKVAAYKSKMALNVDETNAIFVTEDDKIQAGKALFNEKCSVCHGNVGQGIIGPNLTDNHWLYGNKPGDLFKIVKNGTNKGMKSWKDEINPVNIQNIISYIHTLQGTNPAGAKAPEGELMSDAQDAGMATDSATVKSGMDTLKSLEVKL